jgi:methyl-accepting chemotaxis protein
VTSSSSQISERLEFLGFDDRARRNISDVRDLVQQALPRALDEFYEQVDRTPHTRRLFKDRSHMQSAKSRQVGHWDAISRGEFDDRYLEAVTTVGKVHARIGLEPRWYIGGYARLLDTLIKAVVKGRWSGGGFGKAKADPEKVGAELGALAKATLLDMDLAISVYLDALETERVKAETARAEAAAEQTRVLRLLAQGLSAMASGDLTTRIHEQLEGEHEAIRNDFNAAIARLESTIAGVSRSIHGLDGGANEIASASDDLARRTEQQAASLEETAAALDEITATVHRSAEGANRAASVVSEARAQAERSGTVVSDAVAAMSEIEESSGQITNIIGVIDEIAFQTNLLALNAGVEAARAGEAGRGFAVVASEVRALAQRSAEAAKEIKGLIASSSSQVERGVKLVGETGAALSAIVDKVGAIDSLIFEISKSSGEQATGLDAVNVAVNRMDQFTQQNAAMVEEAAAAVGSLKKESAALKDQVGHFVYSGDQSGRTFAPVRRPAPTEAPRPALKRAAGGADTNWEEF